MAPAKNPTNRKKSTKVKGNSNNKWSGINNRHDSGQTKKRSPRGEEYKTGQTKKRVPRDEDYNIGANRIICGRNAVMETLKSGNPVSKIWLANGDDAAFCAAVFKLAAERDIPCRKIPRAQLEKLAGPDHRGVAAELAAIEYVDITDILAIAAERGEQPCLVVLDGVEDPHNLGAVIRTALCAGAHGVVIGKRRSASVNETVMRTSSGAAAYLPVARVSNLVQAVQTLQKEGCWAVAADMDGENLWHSDLTGPIVLVMGNEGEGVSPLLKKTCDKVVSIPMKGKIGSLNVSNAAAVLMYEIVRQRGIKS